MTDLTLELCPGCLAKLPPSAGGIHRYIGASAACWALFTALSSGGEPPLAPDPLLVVLADAYLVQHPGTPSPQTIQSAAVHLLTLYGVLEAVAGPDGAMAIRLAAVSERSGPKRGRYQWLTPPSFAGCLTVAEIVRDPTPAARTKLVRQYIQDVWSRWQQLHAATIAGWYDQFIAPAS